MEWDLRGNEGTLIGIARRPKPRATMEEVAAVDISTGGGLDGDHKGLKFTRRGVTLLSREDWEAAVAMLADLAGPVPLAWTIRRANLLVEGLALPQAKGAVITVGTVLLEVTAETYPCSRMEAAHRGLLRALAPEWRGGVTCKVVQGGRIELGNRVVIVSSPKPHRPKLPG